MSQRFGSGSYSVQLMLQLTKLFFELFLFALDCGQKSMNPPARNLSQAEVVHQMYCGRQVTWHGHQRTAQA
jgi:hypothetical protein